MTRRNNGSDDAQDAKAGKSSSSPGNDNGTSNPPKKRSDLITVLGSGAVNERVRSRVLERGNDTISQYARPIRSVAGDASGLSHISATFEQIYQALMTWDQDVISGVTRDLLRAEVNFAGFYRDLAVPLAYRLGDAWIDDTISMVDVEFATSRLVLWCDQYATEDNERFGAVAKGRTIILARTENEMHTLGLAILSKCYAHAGWRVLGGSSMYAGRPMFIQLRADHVDAVGLTIGSSLLAEDCRRLIAEIRAVSRNPDIIVGIGGPALVADAEGFADVGADFIAFDAVEAVEISEELLDAA